MAAQGLFETVDVTVKGVIGGADLSTVEALLLVRGQLSMALSAAVKLLI